MKKMMKKLKSQAGETIAEVLIALLISTIALLMLAAMINSSSNSILTARNTMQAYYSAAGESGTGKVNITLKSSDGTTQLAEYKENAVTTATKTLGGKTILSYKVKTGGAP